MREPHDQQKCAACGLSAPHRQQYRPGPATARTGDRTAAVHAHTRAHIQPITVQPSSKFKTKIPANECLSCPMMEGKKYKTPQKMKKNIRVLLSQNRPLGTRSGLSECKYGEGGSFVPAAES